MKTFEIKKGKVVSIVQESKNDDFEESLLALFREERRKNRKIIVLTTAYIINWDPRTDGGRVALLKHLNENLPLSTYTSLFPELTLAVLADINKRYLMADYINKASDNANSAAHSVNDYKRALFDGPATVSMTTVSIPAVYGVAPVVVPADIMDYVSNLRGLLMKNPNWTDAIAKALWLYGTDATFDKDTYQAHFSVNPFPGYLHLHVSTKHVKTHNIYIRKVGVTAWDTPIRFDGANFDVHRPPASAPENLEVMVRGIINNVETPLLSAILPVPYNATI